MTRRLQTAWCAGLVLAVCACTPAMNWREAHLARTDLKIMMPCRPDKGSKSIELNGQTSSLNMIGCEADGVLFAVSQLELPPGTLPGVVMAQWQSSVASGINAAAPSLSSYAVKGEIPAGLGTLLEARGKRSDAQPVSVKAVWFVKNNHIFHAAMYAEQLPPEAADTFFSGLTFP